MKINKILPRVKQQLGFTMIELLIVIAILGILAVVVLSAINPIQQINRGRDTGSRSDAEQLISAIDRFYAMKGYYPWQTGATDTANVQIAWSAVDEDLSGLVAGATETCPILNRLSDVTGTLGDPGELCAGQTGAQELKIGFMNKVAANDYNTLYLYHAAGDSDSTYVCFATKSNSFIQETTERLQLESGVPADGAVPSDYPVADAIGNTDDCGSSGNCVCLP